MTDTSYILPAILNAIFALCIGGTAWWFWTTGRYAHATFLALLMAAYARVVVTTLVRGGYLPEQWREVTAGPAFMTINTTLLLVAFAFVLFETKDARRRMKMYQRHVKTEDEHEATIARMHAIIADYQHREKAEGKPHD